MNLIEALVQMGFPVVVDGCTINTKEELEKALATGSHNIERFVEKQAEKLYEVKVKKWMLQKSTPDFTFMEKMNKNIPMPLITMRGKIIESNTNNYKMDLQGFLPDKPYSYCVKCGKKLTNSVSLVLGIGPECGGHSYVNPFETEEELKKAASEIRTKLEKVLWTGYIPKSAIVSLREI